MGKNSNDSNVFCYVRSVGVDGKEIFNSREDVDRFIIYLDFLNSEHGKCFFRDINQETLQPRTRWASKSDRWDIANVQTSKFVSVISFSITPFEINLLLKQEVENGISRFMQKLLGGYTRYFNEKFEREGALFAGRYKREYITDDEVPYFASYINMYHLTKPKKYWCAERTITSLADYSKNTIRQFPFINTHAIFSRFKNEEEYRSFAVQAVLKLVREFELDSESDAITVLQSH